MINKFKKNTVKIWLILNVIAIGFFTMGGVLFFSGESQFPPVEMIRFFEISNILLGGAVLIAGISIFIKTPKNKKNQYLYLLIPGIFLVLFFVLSTMIYNSYSFE